MDNELAVLGAALLLAGLFARLGRRLGLPTIPFFIVAGIIFGPQTPERPSDRLSETPR